MKRRRTELSVTSLLVESQRWKRCATQEQSGSDVSSNECAVGG
ncbi:MAG: hypothetical protein WBM24_21260 [Candidatus Sulfotelmatobacter sp.]